MPENGLGTVYEPKEPNECNQPDFWGPIKYLNESEKHILVAVDRFSRRPSAMICKNNKSKDFKIQFQIHKHSCVSRKIYMDQGSNFTPRIDKDFCNTEGIEVVNSPVNDRVRRTNYRKF